MRQLFTVPLVVAAALGLAACSSKSDTDNGAAGSNVSAVDDAAAVDANLAGDNGTLGSDNAVDAGPTDGNAVDTQGNAGEVTGNAL